MHPKSNVKENRLVWLDALRFYLFFLLILFHAGMPFNTWDWHIKSFKTSAYFNLVMVFFSSWRLSLLFMVSGFSSGLFLENRKESTLLGYRLPRLIPPLIAGFFILSPIMIWIEGELEKKSSSFLQADFYPNGIISWHHLWYLGYLIGISIIFHTEVKGKSVSNQIVYFFNILKSRYGYNFSGIVFLFLFFLGYFFLAICFEEQARSSRDVWGSTPSFFKYSLFYLFGFSLHKNGFFVFIQKLLPLWILTGFALTILLYHLVWIQNASQHQEVKTILGGFHKWMICLSILGIAEKIMKKNRNIYKSGFFLYVIHQPLIFLLFALLRSMFTVPLWSYLILASLSFLSMVILQRYMNRFPNILKPFLGIRER